MTAARIGTWGAIAGSAAVVIAPLGYRIGVAPLGLAFALLALGFLRQSIARGLGRRQQEEGAFRFRARGAEVERQCDDCFL